MSDTIREKIIRQIADRLAVITLANGYATDIGANVKRARKHLDESELPACVIHPQPETPELKYGQSYQTMPVRIEGIVEYGDADPSAVSEQILGDLIKAVTEQPGTETSPNTGWVRSPQYDESIHYKGGGTDEYPDEERLTVGAAVQIEVVYATKIGDPYAQ